MSLPLPSNELLIPNHGSTSALERKIYINLLSSIPPNGLVEVFHNSISLGYAVPNPLAPLVEFIFAHSDITLLPGEHVYSCRVVLGANKGSFSNDYAIELAAVETNRITLESGDFLLTEDGSYITTESTT